MIVTIRCKLLAIQEGQYTIYVFENLDEELSSRNKYISCTKLPNWNFNEVLELGQVGYLHCEFVTAGETYYKLSETSAAQYKYTNCYFINFIREKEKIDNKEYKF